MTGPSPFPSSSFSTPPHRSLARYESLSHPTPVPPPPPPLAAVPKSSPSTSSLSSLGVSSRLRVRWSSASTHRGSMASAAFRRGTARCGFEISSWATPRAAHSRAIGWTPPDKDIRDESADAPSAKGSGAALAASAASLPSPPSPSTAADPRLLSLHPLTYSSASSRSAVPAGGRT